MSAALLQRVKAHIMDDGGLLTGYTPRFFRWTDTDLRGAGSVALFRMTGTGGAFDWQVQFSDVSLFLLTAQDAAASGADDMLAVSRYLHDSYSTDGAFYLFPLGAFTGPAYLENGRASFELVIRTGTTDH
jgi:hypothetical protein